MSEENIGSQPTDQVQPEPTTVNTSENQVSDTDLHLHAGKALVDENRKYRNQKRASDKRADDAEAKLKEIERAKLESEGKHKEASEFYKKEADEWKVKFESATGSYATTIITSQVKAQAAQMGCIDPDALCKLAPMQDLADDVDENYIVKPEAVKGMLDMMQKRSPYLFKKQAPVIENQPLNPQAVQQETAVGTTGTVTIADLALQIANASRK